MAKITSSTIVLTAALLCAVFDEFALGEQHSGTAAFYTPPYVPTACGLIDSSRLPPGNQFAAASDAIWKGGLACFTNYQINCTGGTNLGVPHPCRRPGTITVQIIDYCRPPKCQETFDLSQEAFAHIADPNAGKITIEYSRV